MNYNCIIYFLFVFSIYASWVRSSVGRDIVHLVSLIGICLFFVLTRYLEFNYFTFLLFLFCGFIFVIYSIFSKTVELRVYRGLENFFKKWVSHPIEAIFGFIFYTFIKTIPIKTASRIGEKLGRFCANLNIPVNKKALQNIKMCFPKKTENECREILINSWIVFLRFVFETPKLNKVYKNHDKYVSIEGLQKLKKIKGKPIVAIFAHYGNISMIPLPFYKLGIKSNVIFRFPNNRLMSWFFFKIIAFANNLKAIPKGDHGNRLSIKALKRKEALIIAADQRFEGVGSLKLKFFGFDAPTAPGPVKLAKSFNAPIVPIQVIQLPNLKCKVIVHSPFMTTSNEKEDTQKINDIIEGWVKQYPEQWFWLHKRWGK